MATRAPIVPLKNAPFTLKKVRDAIPAHCWKRSNLTSFLTLARDLLMAGALWYLSSFIDLYTAGVLNVVAWAAFAFAQGTVLTGVWVLAHECGHGAFSESDNVNNAVGLVLHSFLLVPYYAWKFTHAAHHGSTNHMTKDQVFVPPDRKAALQTASFYDDLEDVPLWNLAYMLRMVTVGWPAYLLLNISGQQTEEWNSHFKPSSKDIFKKDQRKFVSLSGWALVAVIGAFSMWINRFGALSWLKLYFGPYLFVNYWLIMYTFLQHTDESLPHYSASQWNYSRGALATIDRDYGVWDFFHHKIGSTHVLHHFFSRIPHYHAEEASQAIQKVLGEYYVKDTTNPFVAFWRQYVQCKFVDHENDKETAGILWFKRSFKAEQKAQ